MSPDKSKSEKHNTHLVCQCPRNRHSRVGSVSFLRKQIAPKGWKEGLGEKRSGENLCIMGSLKTGHLIFSIDHKV